MKSTRSRSGVAGLVTAVSLSWSTPGLAGGIPELRFTNRTNWVNGSPNVQAVFAGGGKVFVGGGGDLGLQVSANGGNSWEAAPVGGSQVPPGEGVVDYYGVVNGIHAEGGALFAATTGIAGGVSISGDGGATWTRRNTAHGLGSDQVIAIDSSSGVLYASTWSTIIGGSGGLSRSVDGGATWTTFTTAHGLASNNVRRSFAVGNSVYAATTGGLSISANGGQSWTSYGPQIPNSMNTGWFASEALDVWADQDGATIIAATSSGIYVSVGSGNGWISHSVQNGLGAGLGSDTINALAIHGSLVFAATENGLSVWEFDRSNPLNAWRGGWTNFTVEHGLGSNQLRDVFVDGDTLYVATAGGLSIATIPGPCSVAVLGISACSGLRRRRAA